MSGVCINIFRYLSIAAIWVCLHTQILAADNSQDIYLEDSEVALPLFQQQGPALVAEIQDSANNDSLKLDESSIFALLESLPTNGAEVTEQLVRALNQLTASQLNPTANNSTLQPLLDTTLSLAKDRDQAEILGTAHSNYATYFFFQNDVVAALDHLLFARDAYTRAGEISSLVFSMVDMHYSYRSLGQYGDAQSILHEALTLTGENPDRTLAREVYFSLGNVYQQMGDLERAEYYVQLALEIDIELNRHAIPTNDARRILGKILRERNKTANAIDMHERALLEARPTEFGRLIAFLQEQLALDHLALGNLEAARQQLEAAYSETEFGRQLASYATSQKYKAMLLIAQQRMPEAIELLLSAAESDTYREQTLANRIEVSQLLMQAYQQSGEFENAIAQGQKAVALTQTISGQLEASRLGPAWSSRSNIIYKQLADLLLERYYNTGTREYLAQAFNIVEQSRSYNLLQQRNTTLSVNMADSSDIDQLRHEIAEISTARAALEPLDDNYHAVTLDYYRTLERYQSRLSREESETSYQETPIDMLAGRLAPDTFVFEYLCVPESDCHLMTLIDGKLDAHRLASYSEVSLLVNAVNTELYAGAGNDFPGIEKLSDTVLSNFLPASKNNLMVVLDYPLNKIPLSVLSTSNTSYQPLINNFTLSYIPSLQAFNYQDLPEQNYPVELAVLADPVFSQASMPQQLSAVDTFRGWVNDLEPLPWSAIEANNLKTIFNDQDIRVFTGTEANRNNLFAEETRNARILHLASHAFFNESMADLVGIAISSTDSGNPSEGDFITLNELQLSRFNAELVVISGCETGRGEYLQGEGSMSLARGFLAQGANHVISTLWPVSDRASAEFMKLFYQALHQEGLSIARSLQSAQTQLRQNPRYQDPVYWAPYVLTSIAE